MSGALPYLRTQSSIYFNTCYLSRPREAQRDLEDFSLWCGSMRVQGAQALLDLYKGWIALAEDRLEESRRHLELAVPALETGIANRVPYALNALAEVFLKSRSLEASCETALNAVIWNREHGNREQLTCSLRLLAEALIAVGDLDRAGHYLAEAGRIARMGYFKPHLAWIYESYAHYWVRQGNVSLARDWNRNAYEAWKVMGNHYQAARLLGSVDESLTVLGSA
ncbi:MAG: hypothetical protein BWY77_01907 [bacterium ADurb.Bin431]|nr:MAG: hypothetical protein BWY77_01907 [bacterium ADurb.Bin431]